MVAGQTFSETLIHSYVIAEDDLSVFEWIDREHLLGQWAEEDDNVRHTDDTQEHEIPFRDWVMKHCGDLDDEEGWEDDYYGIYKWGWEQVRGATPSDIDRLMGLGIAHKI